MTVIISFGKYVFFVRKHSVTLMGLGLLLLVMITAAIVAAQTSTPVIDTAYPQTTQSISADTAQALHSVFEANDYDWPPAQQKSVPPLLLTELPEDLGQLPSHNIRRELFLRSLLPIVLIENRRLQEQRALAAWLLDGNLPVANSPMDNWLAALAKQFKVRGNLAEPEVREKLLGRLNVIPPTLALAQAAIESGWGSSRFALEGNSLFGQWTYNNSKGLKPNQRDEEATHFVASFPDLQASVRAYMHNLNTGNAYHEFRAARAIAQSENQPLSATELAAHLHRYSERGEDYVADLRQIIRSPAIAALRQASLEWRPNALTVTLSTGRQHAGG